MRSWIGSIKFVRHKAMAMITKHHITRRRLLRLWGVTFCIIAATKGNDGALSLISSASILMAWS